MLCLLDNDFDEQCVKDAQEDFVIIDAIDIVVVDGIDGEIDPCVETCWQEPPCSCPTLLTMALTSGNISVLR